MLKVLLVALSADETYLRRPATMLQPVVSFGQRASEMEGVGLEFMRGPNPPGRQQK